MLRVFFDNAFIGTLHQIGALSYFEYITETEFAQGLLHRFKRNVEICCKAWCDDRHDRFVLFHEHFDHWDIVDIFFCVLWADDGAVAAEDAFAGKNGRGVIFDADGFHRAIAHAFVAVFTVDFFEFEDAHGRGSFRCIIFSYYSIACGGLRA